MRRKLRMCLIYAILVSLVSLSFSWAVRGALQPIAFRGWICAVSEQDNLIEFQTSERLQDEWETHKARITFIPPSHDVFEGLQVGDYVETVFLGAVQPDSLYLIARMRSEQDSHITDVYGDPQLLDLQPVDPSDAGCPPPFLGGYTIAYENKADCSSCTSSHCRATETTVGVLKGSGKVCECSLQPSESCTRQLDGYELRVTFHSGEVVCQPMPGPQAISNLAIRIRDTTCGTVARHPRIIEFGSAYDHSGAGEQSLRWEVKDSGDDRSGPGPNNWSDSEENVCVDERGLHLAITQDDNNPDAWNCAEVSTEEPLGYGEYVFYLDGRPDLLGDIDKNLVLGLFSYLNKHHEIDIEFTKAWAIPYLDLILNHNAYFSVKPDEWLIEDIDQWLPDDIDQWLPEEIRKWIPKDLCIWGESIHPFHLNPDASGSVFQEKITCKFTWGIESICFQVFYGHSRQHDPGTPIWEWTYNAASDDNTPAEVGLRAHINFWLFQGQSPTDESVSPIPFTIADFRFYKPKLEDEVHHWFTNPSFSAACTYDFKPVQNAETPAAFGLSLPDGVGNWGVHGYTWQEGKEGYFPIAMSEFHCGKDPNEPPDNSLRDFRMGGRDESGAHKEAVTAHIKPNGMGAVSVVQGDVWPNPSAPWCADDDEAATPTPIAISGNQLYGDVWIRKVSGSSDRREMYAMDVWLLEGNHKNDAFAKRLVLDLIFHTGGSVDAPKPGNTVSYVTRLHTTKGYIFHYQPWVNSDKRLVTENTKSGEWQHYRFDISRFIWEAIVSAVDRDTWADEETHPIPGEDEKGELDAGLLYDPKLLYLRQAEMLIELWDASGEVAIDCFDLFYFPSSQFVITSIDVDENSRPTHIDVAIKNEGSKRGKKEIILYIVNEATGEQVAFHSATKTLDPNKSATIPMDHEFTSDGVYTVYALTPDDTDSKQIRVEDQPIENAAASSTVLVIDTSGSMNWDDPSGVSKIRAARTAATEFINMIDRENETFGSDHQASLVTFSGSASLLSPLTKDVETLRKRIAQLSAGGGTNMYEGLSLANKQLSSSTGEPIILLLSDGVPTAGPPNSGDYKQHEEEVLSGPVREAMSHGYCIYAVGFGKPGEIVQGEPSIDPDFLNAVVQATGCAPSFYPATEASELLFTFVDMRQDSMEREEVGRSKGTIQQGQSMDLGAITVPPRQKALYANLTWPGSQLDLNLVDPRGREVDANYPGAGIGVYENMVYEIIEEPLSGTWKASVYGRDIPSGSTKFAFLASVEPAEERPEEPPAEEPELGLLEIRSSGPIDLILKDPQGRIVSKEFPTVDGIEYIERFDASTDATVDEITVPSRMVGDYQIRVLTEAGAERLQRFDLVATDGFDTVTLANRKFIIHAPKEPYVIRCTQEGFFDATGLPEEPVPEEKPTHDAGISILTIVLIAAGSVTLIAGIIGILYFLRSRYYI